MRCFLICLLFVENYYSCSEKAIEKATSYGKTSVLADSFWCDFTSTDCGAEDLPQPLGTSFKRSCFLETSTNPCSESGRDGAAIYPMEMQALQATLQGYSTALSKLWEGLEQVLRPKLCPQCQDKTDNSWSWTAPREASPRTRATRPRSASERARAKKGKGKGKQPKGDGGTPPSYTLPSPPAVPWMPEANLGESSAPSAQAALDSELLAAIKRSYPDASQMPSEIKLMVEKSQSLVNKQTTRDLHLGTTQLGKAKKCMDELTESRGAHRKAWMNYLKECTDSLTLQQEKFTEQEKQFAELMGKAKAEMQGARSTIQALSAQSGTTMQADPPSQSMDEAAIELEGLQQQTEKVLQASNEALRKLKTEKLELIDLSLEEDGDTSRGTGLTRARSDRSRSPLKSSS